jgi:ribonuclease E
MSKEIYISSTPHETRLAIVENDALAEIYYERENEYTLAGSIYNGRVTRVLPGMQSSFVDIGLERDAFLYITDFMEEAPDSADFDTTDTRGSGRAPRREALPAGEAVEGEPTARSENGRGRGDGRDRNRDRNRGPRDGRSGGEARPQEARPSFEEQARVAPSENIDAEPLDSDAGDVGEGAPGADGTRRWRGRRGRRRGRGDEAGTPHAAPVSEVIPEVSAVAAEQPRREDRGPRQDRNDRGDRGGRNDRGGRGDRAGRGDGGRDRDRSAARPSRSEGESFEAAPTTEPFILPGESLSKYRRGEDRAAETAPQSSTPTNVTVVTAKPSTLVEPALNWDGGFVLPGETLSRHRGAETRGNDSRSSYDSRRDKREDRPARQEVHPSEAVEPAVTSQHEPEPFEISLPAAPVGSESVTDVEPFVAHDEHASEEEHVEAVEAAAVEAEHVAAEYEPAEEASVSFRVDPVAVSEFRQSTPTPDEFIALEEEGDKETAAAEAKIEETLAEPVFAADEYIEAEALPAHEFTAVQPTGEMVSDAIHSASEAHADAPIEHEKAIQSVTLNEAEIEAELPPVAVAQHGYAPGDGELEEEVLDEDEGDLPTLHAQGEHDDMEEETLEGAADLGSMIQEMSIDKITGPGSDDEEDDFDIDEEDLDEDQFDTGEADEELSGSDVSEGEEEEFAEGESFEENGTGEESQPRVEGQGAADPARSTGDRRPRRDGRSGRRGERDRGKRDSRGMAGSRSGGGFNGGGSGGGGGRSRQSMQSTNLPDISDLLKPGQELLVQIAKEPIAKKGARITSHIALPGRFLVFMPTVNHVGVSRKIESDGERRRLKEILLSEKGEASGGFIVRTAAASATEEELRSDLRFLLNLWADIKQRSESSKSPALIYHDLNLIERILRDQVTDNFSAIWVDSESEYERVLRFLQRFQPSLIRRVKLYTKETPLFEQFGITEQINNALRSKVWLKSGGSIVINQTEALVAIDINTGKFVGKTARLEDTIVKTNLDAIPEIVRQIRLRDLGGIIIIDFIDMDERKNRNKVMAALEEELKADRAPSKVLQFNDFGLVAITRKRVKQSLERTLSTTCGVCQGTGMVKSPVTVCNDIYIEMKKMQKHLDKGDVMLRVNPEVVKQLKAPGTKWLQEMEEMVGKTILVKSDASIHPEQFDIH